MNAVKIFLMTALLTAVTMTAFGQQESSPIKPGGQFDEGGVQNTGQPGRGGPMAGERREEVRKKIEAVRIWRLNEALELDPDTSAKLSSILSSYGRQRKVIRRVQMRTMRALRLAVKSQKPDELKIKANLDKLEKNRHAMQDLRNNEFRAVKNILTIEQQARYIVFEKEFMQEMRGMINKARGRGRGGAGMGPNGNAGRGGGQMQGGPGDLPDN
jgi:Spy/CpxP family protein refolding chaperone